MEPSINNTASLLNDAQKRSLSVSLRLLEEELFIIQLLAGNGRRHGHLFSLEVDFNAEQRRRLHQEIKRILSYIHNLKERFDLEAEGENLSRRLVGAESYYWTVLCDQKSDKLKRYGAISNALPDILDPVLDQIMDALRKMVEVIKEDSGTANGQDKGNTVRTSS